MYPAYSHVCTADQAACLDHWIAETERALVPATPEMITSFVGNLAIGLKAPKVSDEEADVQLTQYVQGLADIPRDVLAHAYLAILNNETFMPTVAEVRKRCHPNAVRQWQLGRMKMLRRTYDRAHPTKAD
jgi:hypothetical protein